MELKSLLVRAAGAVALCCSVLFTGALEARAEINPRLYAVEVSAQPQSNPARIVLSWPASSASSYTVSRKPLNSSSWSQLASLGGGASSFTDENVAVGQRYEYRIQKNAGYTGFGYIYAGIDAALIDTRGKVLLLVDNTYAADLAAELSRLQQDLIGDGWTVVRRDVPRSMAPPQVKQIIQTEYNNDRANMRSVFIFGHVAVPYSGTYAYDGHDDHYGAWPADTYYADMDNGWSDSHAYSSGNPKPANQNRPGDGKFDQNSIPSDVELEVGRVDLANMTCFANKPAFPRDEKYLLRQYLNKDHNFRHRKFTIARRGVVCDNWGERGGEAFAASGWRNFAPFFGASAVTALNPWSYFSSLKQTEALFSWAGGGGGWTSADGVGGSDDWATNDPKTVFTMSLGSYFGDWDNESAFLRAPLGATSYTLSAAWAGRPHWVFHHMGSGETLGLGAKLTMNNTSGGPYQAQGQGTRGTHIALMGDPTLRLHPVIPPSNVNGVTAGGSTTLAWAPSNDTDVVGYHVYRASALNGSFTRLTSSPLNSATYVDVGGSGVYMVRAIKFERSGSGTYYNSSQGAFWPAGTSLPPSEPPPTGSAPSAPSGLAATTVSASQVNLSWNDNANTETAYRVERRTASGAHVIIANLPANTRSYSDASLAPNSQYFYRIAASNASGSAHSSEVSAQTQPGVVTVAAATFIKTDATTSGSWSGVYGKDGYSIPALASALPAYASLAPNGASEYQWTDTTTDARALQKVTGNRIASCWYSANTYTLDLNLADGAAHRVALYFLDWDRSGRSQTVEILNTAGAVLDTQTVSGFENGKYLVWDLKGQIKIRLTRLTGANTVTMGIFFDAPTGTSGSAVTAEPVLAAGKFNLRVKGQAGQRYKISYSTNLTSWTELTTVTLTAPTYDYVDPNPLSEKTKFYRAVLVP